MAVYLDLRYRSDLRRSRAMIRARSMWSQKQSGREFSRCRPKNESLIRAGPLRSKSRKPRDDHSGQRSHRYTTHRASWMAMSRCGTDEASHGDCAAVEARDKACWKPDGSKHSNEIEEEALKLRIGGRRKYVERQDCCRVSNCIDKYRIRSICLPATF